MYKYKKIKLKDGTTRDEHRLIMEEKLGRKLKKNECVHHKNGNGRDNREENLELIDRSKHSSNHLSGRIIKEETKMKLREKFLGEKSPNAKITKKIANKIRYCLLNGKTIRETANLFNIGRATVFDIKHNNRWV